MRVLSPLVAFLLCTAWLPAQDQAPFEMPKTSPRHSGLSFRELGPTRGGRVAAVCGIPSDRKTYYFGSAGGGVWKTEDAGIRWRNVSDGFFGGSIGAVAVSEWDPNVIYVGGGEKTVRGNVSHGDGIHKSTDAGKTWSWCGLPESRHVCRLRIHPRDPELVYAAVLGHLFGPNEERGVYRSKDGGKSWERILHVNPHAGAVDLAMDPTNPRILYASFWRVLRTPWSLESGGEGSSLWKSVDGGDHWVELSKKPGMPKGPLGISGVSVARSDPETVYAIIEAKDGGVFRSRDGGENWSRVNSERKLRQRAWYYSRIQVDPKDADVVYVLNVRFHKSKDGGKTFAALRTPHSDNHDLWIDPADPLRMIESNDGGANVSDDGGKTWTRQDNQPTAQVYRIATDDATPFRLLGGQQDNSAFRIRSRPLRGSRIGLRDWEPTAGGESGHIAAKPGHPDLVFGGSYDGYLSRYDHRTGQSRAVQVWPDNPMGWGAEKLKYRFQWNYPLHFSRHDPERLYAAAQILFRSHDEGASWQAMSPDLTRNDKSKQGSSGGPITKDNTSVEYHGTIFAIAESAHEPGVLWTGSDDGRVHLTRDDGKSWQDVTPPALPEWSQINSIEAHPFEPGGLYVAATRYRQDDFRPSLWRTTDWGKSWAKIDHGIPDQHFTRVIRADPERRGLLFAGTERGLYCSFDDGARWESFQLDLPIVPITDLQLKEGKLCVATQGRGVWILDDLSILRQSNDLSFTEAHYLFTPEPVERIGGRFGQLVVRYHLREEVEEKTPMSLAILDADGKELRRFDADTPGPKLGRDAGLNTLRWDLRLQGPERIPGMILWNGGGLRGPQILPGDYELELTIGEWKAFSAFSVHPNRLSSATPEDLRAQFDFLKDASQLLDEINRGVKGIGALRGELKRIAKHLKDHPELKEQSKAFQKAMTEVEEALYQTKNRSRQDPLNFPIRLNDKLAGLISSVQQGDFAPTRQAVEVRRELGTAIDAQLERLEKLYTTDLPKLVEAIEKAGIPRLDLPKGIRSKPE